MHEQNREPSIPPNLLLLLLFPNRFSKEKYLSPAKKFTLLVLCFWLRFVFSSPPPPNATFYFGSAPILYYLDNTTQKQRLFDIKTKSLSHILSVRTHTQPPLQTNQHPNALIKQKNEQAISTSRRILDRFDQSHFTWGREGSTNSTAPATVIFPLLFWPSPKKFISFWSLSPFPQLQVAVLAPRYGSRSTKFGHVSHLLAQATDEVTTKALLALVFALKYC